MVATFAELLKNCLRLLQNLIALYAKNNLRQAQILKFLTIFKFVDFCKFGLTMLVGLYKILYVFINRITFGKTMIDTSTRHITPVDGNIFLDLGFPPDEADKLKADSDMLIKTKLALANSVSEWIDENHLKQEQAAEILGISRPRVSDVVNKKIGKFTIDALMSMLIRAGKNVQIQIS